MTYGQWNAMMSSRVAADASRRYDEARTEQVRLENEKLKEMFDILATENMLEVNKLCNERDEAREQNEKLRLEIAELKKSQKTKTIRKR